MLFVDTSQAADVMFLLPPELADRGRGGADPELTGRALTPVTHKVGVVH